MLFQNTVRLFIVLLFLLLLGSCGTQRTVFTERIGTEEFYLVNLHSNKKRGETFVGFCRIGSGKNEINISMYLFKNSCDSLGVSKGQYEPAWGKPQKLKKLWRNYVLVYDSVPTVAFSEQERKLLNIMLQKQKELGGCRDGKLRFTTGLRDKTGF